MIYFIRASRTEFVKIGFTNEDPTVRRAQLQTSSPHRLVIERLMDGDERVERRLHGVFREKQTIGEWFRLTPDEVVGVEGSLSSFDSKRARALERLVGTIVDPAADAADLARRRERMRLQLGDLYRERLGLAASLLRAKRGMCCTESELGDAHGADCAAAALERCAAGLP